MQLEQERELHRVQILELVQTQWLASVVWEVWEEWVACLLVWVECPAWACLEWECQVWVCRLVWLLELVAPMVWEASEEWILQ